MKDEHLIDRHVVRVLDLHSNSRVSNPAEVLISIL